ncbi:MAG TPA: RagB/SusD family nutrient uptake outer membrane protein, partial [Chloroflexota bacterium]|nr:RagB/SusD family nutrient uptake outer membrane protein [Chloroflexota bacterium]
MTQRFMTSKMRKGALGILAPVACLALLTQCDDFLETQPFGTLNTGTFYTTARDFEAATIGAYSTLQNLTYAGRGASLFELALRPDDDVRSPGSNADNDFSWTASTGSSSYIWNVAYRAVLRSNLILQQLEQADQLTPEQKARFAGEAKFVRAYFYFILARYWGTPPVITQVATSPSETRPSNSQPGEVWNLIEQDLTDAIAGLAGLQLETGRANEWAARALLGKVRIYRAQWGQGDAAILGGTSPTAKYQQAITPLQEIVNSGRYELVPYRNNFDYRTENNRESIFELQASFGTDINGWAAVDENGGGASSGTGRHLATGASGGPGGATAPGGFDWGDGGVVVAPTLVNAFETYGTRTVPLPQDPTKTVEVTIRDPRAYWTFYSTGEEYGRVCPAAASGTPAPYNFRWRCESGNLVVGDMALWSVTGHTPAKYIRPYENFAGGQNQNQSVSLNNERLIRYADVLLLLAEARLLGNNDVAGAAALINQVRARARDAWESVYGPQSPDAALYGVVNRPANLLEDRPAGASVPQMHAWLRQERRVEMALELYRWDDLARWLR